jgi:hypothetical protein
MVFNIPAFAQECVRQGLYCGVYPHYMVAVAKLRSGMTDTNDGDEIGPFRLLQVDWNAFCTDIEFDFHFLPKDINSWDMQSPIFALMAHRAFDKFVKDKGKNPTASELYLAQWPATAPGTVSADLQNALDATATLIDEAAGAVLDDPIPPLAIDNPDQSPPPPSTGPLNLTGVVKPARQSIANKITNAFAAAQLGKLQQAAGLANAIAESNLDPNAHAAIGEDSWGLFQLNRQGGLGKGHNPDDLKNPDINIAIVLAEAKKYLEFTNADTIDRAVSAFVRDVERPRDVLGQIVARLAIAQKLLA